MFCMKHSILPSSISSHLSLSFTHFKSEYVLHYFKTQCKNSLAKVISFEVCLDIVHMFFNSYNLAWHSSCFACIVYCFMDFIWFSFSRNLSHHHEQNSTWAPTMNLSRSFKWCITGMLSNREIKLNEIHDTGIKF